MAFFRDRRLKNPNKKDMEIINKMSKMLNDEFKKDPRVIERYLDNEMFAMIGKSEKYKEEKNQVIRNIMEHAGFLEILDAYNDGEIDEYYEKYIEIENTSSEEENFEGEVSDDDSNDYFQASAVEQQTQMLRSYFENDEESAKAYIEDMRKELSDNPETLEVFNKAVDNVFNYNTSEVAHEENKPISPEAYYTRIHNGLDDYYITDGWITKQNNFNKIHLSFDNEKNETTVLFVSNQDDMTQYKVFYSIQSNKKPELYRVIKNGNDVTERYSFEDLEHSIDEFRYKEEDILSELKAKLFSTWDNSNLHSQNEYSLKVIDNNQLTDIALAYNLDKIYFDRIELYYQHELPEYNNKIKLHILKDLALKHLSELENTNNEFKYESVVANTSKIESLEASYFVNGDFIKVTNAFSIPGDKNSFTELNFETYRGTKLFSDIQLLYKGKAKSYKYDKALKKLPNHANILDHEMLMEKIKKEIYDVILNIVEKNENISRFENEDYLFEIYAPTSDGKILQIKLAKFQKRISISVLEDFSDVSPLQTYELYIF